MRRVSGSWLTAVVALAVVSMFVAVARAAGPQVLVAGDKHGLAHARDARSHGGGGKTPLLLFHNGPVMTSAAVQAIYWGPSWNNPSFAGDKMTGLATFYGGIGGTSYIKTNTEYTGTNGPVGSGISYGGSVRDSSATPTKDPGTSAILAVVARNITSPAANGYYPVYTDIPRGSAGYCAWHSWGTISGKTVQFAFFFELDGDPGCDPGVPVAGHSQGLDALANVSGHELSEALTDPQGTGWWDRSGAENADKCAWLFNGTEKFSNGSAWYIQGNWSNAAYNTGNGSPRGCINGN